MLSLLIEDRVFHKKALEFMEKNKGECCILTLTLIEVIYNLQKLKKDLDVMEERSIWLDPTDPAVRQWYEYLKKRNLKRRKEIDKKIF